MPLFSDKNKLQANIVTGKDWKKYHPDHIQGTHDLYYISLSNKILKIFLNSTLKKFFFSKNGAIQLSCILGAYFEDVISETNLDFLLKYYKKREYWTEPAISLK
jgi:hypothetical protein